MLAQSLTSVSFAVSSARRQRQRPLYALALISLILFSACSANAPAPRRPATDQGEPAPIPTIYTSLLPPMRWARSRPLTLDQIATIYLSHMSLDDKLGQLFLVALTGTDYNANNAAMVQQFHAGGVLLYTENMTSKQQTTKLIATAQAHATLPLLVLTDEEGGFVDRLTQFYGHRPSATDIGATNDPNQARAQGLQTGKDMQALGFNADFAPDVDVQIVNGPDQNTRTFGSTAASVTSLAGSYLDGMQNANVVACLKHFPGLGAAKTDAHLDLPTIDRSYEQIESVELAPYRALIATGQVGMVMTTDLLMPALDPTLPAELSPIIIDGVLRQELGYDGVVVTDALYMQGVAKHFSMSAAGVLALAAGDDLLVGPFTADAVQSMQDAIRAALTDGTLSQRRIDQSVRRILMLKLRMGALPIPRGVAPVLPLGAMAPTIVDGPVALSPRG